MSALPSGATTSLLPPRLRIEIRMRTVTFGHCRWDCRRPFPPPGLWFDGAEVRDLIRQSLGPQADFDPAWADINPRAVARCALPPTLPNAGARP
jgi:hypothetical protein